MIGRTPPAHVYRPAAVYSADELARARSLTAAVTAGADALFLRRSPLTLDEAAALLWAQASRPVAGDDEPDDDEGTDGAEDEAKAEAATVPQRYRDEAAALLAVLVRSGALACEDGVYARPTTARRRPRTQAPARPVTRPVTDAKWSRDVFDRLGRYPETSAGYGETGRDET